MALRVRVLGGFSVDGLDERSLGTRKARLLLKRLAVEAGRPVPADELASVVWGDELPKNPADQISVLVSRLRSVFGAERLPRTDAGYRLVADWFDLSELEMCVNQIEERLRAGETSAALAAAQTALNLTQGDLLPEEDGDWVDAARPAIERLVARGRQLASEAALAAGEYGAARAAAQMVLDHDPYDETALRLVMRADALAGRPGAALAAYAAVRHRLSEDLGVDPAPDTEDLHTAIVRGEFPGPTPNAPEPSPIVGRDREMALMDGALASVARGRSAAVLIEAEVGMGKSSLLSAWAARASVSALVISGRCDELGVDLPLQPVLDGLATHLELVGREAAADLLGPEGQILDPLLGRSAVSAVNRVTTVSDPEVQRTALFSALGAVLRRAAGERPAVLAIDDLHVSVPGTAEFLAFALRRIPHLLVVATRRPEAGPDLPDGQRITLGPLTAADVTVLVGEERGLQLHARSGGHPLFVRELAGAEEGELPASIVAAIRAQLDRLGDAICLEAAAECGREIDTALVAAITERPVAGVLNDLERAARAGLLRPRGAALVFSHELVREAIEAATSPPRREEIHRGAVVELARRPDADPMALARHARLGGDATAAAAALVAAASHARDRFETAVAEQLLDQAIDLSDSIPARLDRGRLRLARLDLDGARDDALRGIELGAGVDGFELAGWVFYYGRDYDSALRYAEEGVERATASDVRASCLGLVGRIRHTRGDLDEATTNLNEGVAIAPAGIRGMVQIWHAQLLAHRGQLAEATDLARRGLLDPNLPHPFVAGHGYFTLAYTLGLAGQWRAALEVIEELDALASRRGDRRFPPVAANIRGWLLRGVGQIEAAQAQHRLAVEATPGPTFLEAHYAGLLDLVECDFAADRYEEAAGGLADAAGVLEWSGSMSWRHRNRYRLLQDRLASLSGSHADALDDAREIAADSARRGDQRYEARALVVAATIEASEGRATDIEEIGAVVERFVPLAGPDGWRDLARLAQAARSEQIWVEAEKLATGLVAQAGAGPDGVNGAVRRQIDRYRP